MNKGSRVGIIVRARYPYTLERCTVRDGVVMFRMHENSIPFDRRRDIEQTPSGHHTEYWYTSDLTEFHDYVFIEFIDLHRWLSSRKGVRCEIGYWKGTSNIHMRFHFDDPRDSDIFRTMVELIR